MCFNPGEGGGVTSERGIPTALVGGGVPPSPLRVDLLAAHRFVPRVGLKKIGPGCLVS